MLSAGKIKLPRRHVGPRGGRGLPRRNRPSRGCQSRWCRARLPRELPRDCSLRRWKTPSPPWTSSCTNRRVSRKAALRDGVSSAPRPAGLIEVLRGYQNEDGGFGHGLEPDTPLSSEPAQLRGDGLPDSRLGRRARRGHGLGACEFLAHCGRGGTPEAPCRSPSLSSRLSPGRALDRVDLRARSEPDGRACRALYGLGVEHPWRAQAARYCWAQLEAGPPEGVHTLLEVFVFLEHVPERDRAEEHMAETASHLEGFEGLLLDPDSPGYGISPLQFAPGWTRDGATSSPTRSCRLRSITWNRANSQTEDGQSPGNRRARWRHSSGEES